MFDEKQLSAMAVFFWMKYIFNITSICIIFLLYLLFSQYYYISLLYLMWMYFDRNTCNTGGRRLFAEIPFLSKRARDYWPLRLIKTAELDPNKNFICGCHPHGLISCAPLLNFATDATEFSLKFPGIRPKLVSFDILFWVPFVRELLTAFGNISSSKESIKYMLTRKVKGNAIFMLIGGVAEVEECKSDELIVLLRNRKGFVKMAITYGADLVPVLSFGENDMFDVTQSNMNWATKLDEFLKSKTGRSFHFKTFFHVLKNIFINLLPNRVPIYTFVGKAIEVEQNSNPSNETVDFYHNKYIEGVEKLFHECKARMQNDYQNYKLTVK